MIGLIIPAIIIFIIIFAIMLYQEKKGDKMNWTKLLYVLIIVLLYIPMTFLGANVFFPKYTGSDSYYREPYEDCYMKFAYPINATEEQQQAIADNQRKCQQLNNDLQAEWEAERNAYEGNKYVIVTVFNLLILLFALFVPLLQDSVVMGLFLGSLAATFGATMRYFNTNSKVGFAVLVVTFFVMIFFINKKKDSFVDWKSKEAAKKARKSKRRR